VFIAIFALLALSVVGIILGAKGRRIERLRIHLRRVSPGRIFTTFLYSETDADTFMLTSEEWSEELGDKVVDLSCDVSKPEEPVAAVMDLPPKIPLSATESEQLDGGEPLAENEVGLDGGGGKQVQESRIARKPIAPTARLSSEGV